MGTDYGRPRHRIEGLAYPCGEIDRISEHNFETILPAENWQVRVRSTPSGNRSGAVEGQDAVAEKFLQYRPDRLAQRAAQPTRRRDRNAVPQFSLADRRRVNRRCVLCGEPRLDLRGRRGRNNSEMTLVSRTIIRRPGRTWAARASFAHG